MDNKLWLTEEQIEVIVSILKKQCERIEERNQKLSAVIQLYNSGAGKVLDSIEIKDKCRQYNYAGSQKKYGAIQFWTSKKGHLTRAELVEFDEKGSEVKRTIIYKYNAKLIPFVA